MLDQFYKELGQIPMLPEELVQEAYKCIRPNNQISSKKTTPVIGDYTVAIDKDENIITGAIYNRFNASTAIIDWVSDNIHKKLDNDYNIGVQIFLHNFPGQSIVTGPHIDGLRGDYVLNYCLDPGGDNVTTHWYQEIDQPIIRRQLGPHPGFSLNSFEGLSTIAEVICPVNRWHGINVRVLHAVTNLTSTRVALSLGVTEDMFKDIVNRYC